MRLSAFCIWTPALSFSIRRPNWSAGCFRARKTNACDGRSRLAAYQLSRHNRVSVRPLKRNEGHPSGVCRKRGLLCVKVNLSPIGACYPNTNLHLGTTTQDLHAEHPGFAAAERPQLPIADRLGLSCSRRESPTRKNGCRCQCKKTSPHSVASFKWALRITTTVQQNACY